MPDQLPSDSPSACPGIGSSALLGDHIKKWSEVCNELEAMYPNANALLYVHGYVFGLRHAVAIANGSVSAQVSQCSQSGS